MAELTIPSYGKVFALGHRDLDGLLDNIVEVQEKVDGSQMSWAWDASGQLFVKSRSRLQYGPGMNIEDTDGLFRLPVSHLLQQDPITDLIFRGEAIASPRHNVIEYGRVPEGYLVLFDVELPGNGGFWHLHDESTTPDDGGFDCSRLNVERVKTFYGPTWDEEDGLFYWTPGTFTMETVERLLEEESMLGGSKVEGIVVKNYTRTNSRSGRPFLAGKYVSEAFKEVHRAKKYQPGGKDIVEGLVEQLNTEARWAKAVEHLAEQGVLEGSPRDIGALMREVKRDTIEETKALIADALLVWAMPKIGRGLGRGLPEWYKARLAAQQFDE